MEKLCFPAHLTHSTSGTDAKATLKSHICPGWF
jgi:hypothetical protein